LTQFVSMVTLEKSGGPMKTALLILTFIITFMILLIEIDNADQLDYVRDAVLEIYDANYVYCKYSAHQMQLEV